MIPLWVCAASGEDPQACTAGERKFSYLRNRSWKINALKTSAARERDVSNARDGGRNIYASKTCATIESSTINECDGNWNNGSFTTDNKFVA